MQLHNRALSHAPVIVLVAGVQKNTTQQQGNNFNERKPAFGGQQQQNRGK